MKYFHSQSQNAARWFPGDHEEMARQVLQPSLSWGPSGLYGLKTGIQWGMGHTKSWAWGGKVLRLFLSHPHGEGGGGSSPPSQVRRGPMNSLEVLGTCKRGDVPPWLVLTELWHLEQSIDQSRAPAWSIWGKLTSAIRGLAHRWTHGCRERCPFSPQERWREEVRWHLSPSQSKEKGHREGNPDSEYHVDTEEITKLQLSSWDHAHKGMAFECQQCREKGHCGQRDSPMAPSKQDFCHLPSPIIPNPLPQPQSNQQRSSQLPHVPLGGPPLVFRLGLEGGKDFELNMRLNSNFKWSSLKVFIMKKFETSKWGEILVNECPIPPIAGYHSYWHMTYLVSSLCSIIAPPLDYSETSPRYYIVLSLGFNSYKWVLITKLSI